MVLTILTSSLLCSYSFGNLTDFGFDMRKETIISFFSITPKNLRVLDSFIEDNATGTGKGVCAKKKKKPGGVKGR
jgi:hypothetical protein